MSTQPVGLSTQLAPKQVMRAILGSTDLAIWRSTDGVVSAWENRCPHRGMRLSHGFVRGESLACAYHGWHYDSGGKCHLIPAHPELEPPQTIKATAYNIVENAGVLWVNTEGDAEPVQLPENLVAVRSLACYCSIDRVVGAFSTVPILTHGISESVSTINYQDPRVLCFRIDDSADTICIAFQRKNAISTICHILASSTMTSAQLISLSRWADAVKRRAEKTQAGLASIPVNSVSV